MICKTHLLSITTSAKRYKIVQDKKKIFCMSLRALTVNFAYSRAQALASEMLYISIQGSSSYGKKFSKWW